MNGLLALDLGTMTGWACGKQGLVVSGSWDLKPGRYEGGGMRFVKLIGLLDKLFAATPFDQVVFEEVRRHAGTDAAHIYGGLMGTLTAWCETTALPYKGVPVGTIKKYATGNGNASKGAMIAAAKGWGYNPRDDNEADALALWHCVWNAG